MMKNKKKTFPPFAKGDKGGFNIKKIFFSVVFLFLFFSFFHSALAQSGEDPMAGTPSQSSTNSATTPNPNVPGSGVITPNATTSPSSGTTGGSYQNQEKIPGAAPTNDFITYLKSIISFGFAIIGILALFMLIIGAYQYLLAAGSGKAEGAKETITSALLGLILGLCAWIILSKINPDLVNFRPITQITGGSNGSATSSAGQNAATGAAAGAGSAAYSGGAAPVSGTTADKVNSYQSDITAASQKYSVPENVIKGMMDVESSGDPNAKNNTSTASGLMQLTAGAAKDMGVTDVFNPSQSIDGGTHYLANDIKQAGSVEGGIAAYYTGIGNFNSTSGGANSCGGNWQNCNAATVAYVNKVMGKAQSYS